MARPSSPVLNHTAQGRTHWDLTVKGVGTLWYLTYQGQPVQLIKQHRYRPDLSPKYLRTSWPTEATARSWARRLNGYFNSADFSVECLK